MSGVVEYDFGYAIVRVHDGKRTEEERRAVLENAAKEYLRNIQKKNAYSGKGCGLDFLGGNSVRGGKSDCC